MDGTFIIQVTLGGVLLGGIYGLLSLGMSLNLGLLNFMNLAHGSFLILGALTGYGLSIGLGIPPLLGIITVPVLFGGIGGSLSILWVPYLGRREPFETFVSLLLISLGLAFILEEVSASVLTHPLIGLHSGFQPRQWKGITFSPLALILLVVLAGVLLSLNYLLRRTDLGRSLRALSQDLEGALFVGIPLPTVRVWACALSAAAAGLAGMFWVLLFPITPFMGLKLTIISILMVMAAGPGRIIRSIGAGFFWAILEVLGNAVWSSRWGLLTPLLVYLGILFFFPQGLKATK